MIRRDERGVTAPLEYVYTFAVATILITGLIIAATNTAGDQRERTVEAQMDVVAEQVAGSLEAADETVQSTAPAATHGHHLTVEHELPDDLLGGGYTVSIRQTGSGAEVVVSSGLTDDDVTTEATLETSVSTSTVNGGTIKIEYHDSPAGGGGNLVVSDD